MRLFVASSFEPAFVDGIKSVADYARSNAERGSVRWVPPENFHLTYAFLGDLKGPGDAVKGLEAGVKGVKSFGVSLGSFGVFPSARRPSVLWVGIAGGAEELRALAGSLAEGLAAAGLSFENRFEPHVTIGRVKGRLPETFVRRVSDFAPGKRIAGKIVSVELLESCLTADGADYKPLYSRRLL